MEVVIKQSVACPYHSKHQHPLTESFILYNDQCNRNNREPATKHYGDDIQQLEQTKSLTTSSVSRPGTPPPNHQAPAAKKRSILAVIV
jgi:hypothetical protein